MPTPPMEPTHQPDDRNRVIRAIDEWAPAAGADDGERRTGEFFFTREAADIVPGSVDRASRKVSVTAITDKPILRFWSQKSGWFDTVVFIDGIQTPGSGKVPLLDNHNASSVRHVLGSARNFRKTPNAMICDVIFSSTPQGLDAFINLAEGHLTDFSVGLLCREVVFVEEKEQKTVEGRDVQGPMAICLRSELRELSIVIWGADSDAKVIPVSDGPNQA